MFLAQGLVLSLKINLLSSRCMVMQSHPSAAVWPPTFSCPGCLCHMWSFSLHVKCLAIGKNLTHHSGNSAYILPLSEGARQNGPKDGSMISKDKTFILDQHDNVYIKSSENGKRLDNFLSYIFNFLCCIAVNKSERRSSKPGTLYNQRKTKL